MMKKDLFPVPALFPIIIISFVIIIFYIGFSFLPLALTGVVIWYFGMQNLFSRKTKIITALCLWAAAVLSALSPYIIFAADR